MVRAPTIAFTIASSVASTVAVNSGLMRSFETIFTVFGPGSASACGFAVEKAIKISPDPLPEDRPGARQPQRCPPRQPLQLMRQQRGVGRDHNNDRPHIALRSRSLAMMRKPAQECRKRAKSTQHTARPRESPCPPARRQWSTAAAVRNCTAPARPPCSRRRGRSRRAKLFLCRP